MRRVTSDEASGFPPDGFGVLMDACVVASVPAAHPYVRRLSAPGRADGVRRLPDPDPLDPAREASGVWWPPAMLEPAWVLTHDFDLMHLHFGVDERTPQQLRDLVAALRRTARPLVLTLHDLRSPHQGDRRVLDAQLDVLVPAADALLTLTGSAADEVERRWGRRPVVVPHPHVVDLEAMIRIRVERSERRAPAVRRVGLAVKSLRPNTDPGRLLRPLLGVPRTRLVVSVHRDLMAAPRPDAAGLVRALRDAERAGGLELVVHEPFDDAALWAFTATLDVAVLPYRFGSHSGWLEMCHDLGTSVVAPSAGHYAGQGVEGVYDADEDALDEASVVAAVRLALRRRETHGLPGLDAAGRLAQREQVAATHQQVYARALAAVRRAA